MSIGESELTLAGFQDCCEIGIINVLDLMSLMVASSEKLGEFSKEAPLHTDDNLLLEFQAPYYIYKDERGALTRQLTPFFATKS